MSWSGEYDDEEYNYNPDIHYIDPFALLGEAEELVTQLQDYIFHNGLFMLNINTDDIAINMMELIAICRQQ